jgi:tRNA-Thr(GGU) m(6)t(6)A37 methyltransferase TsaA
MTDLKFIGKISSRLKSLDDCPLQEAEDAPPATLEIDAGYAVAAKDLRAGDHIIIFTWLHKGDRSTLSTHPRNDITVPLTGVFSTRSPDRPNPVGIHFSTIVAIDSPTSIVVSNLEVLDGTPVIDIKPDLVRIK